MAEQLIKHPSHSHYFIECGVLCEKYRTIRGLRFQMLLSVGDTEDTDKCTDEQVQELTKKYKHAT